MEYNINTSLVRRNKYKDFNGTYERCAFFMALSLLYPSRDKKIVRRNVLLFLLFLAVDGLFIFWFMMYLYHCFVRGDIYNLTCQLTIAVIMLLLLWKIYLVNVHSDSFCTLMETMNSDLLNGNNVEDDYEEIYDECIKEGKKAQVIWLLIPFVLSSTFPTMAMATMIYNVFFTEKTQPKVMVHELELWHMEDIQYDWPYFEIFFPYHLFQCFALSLNFAGFDGFFCIAIVHICLKMKLFSRKLARAFLDSTSDPELEKKVKEAIRDHQRALDFYNLIRNTFSSWLFLCFSLTAVVISMNMYQLSLRGGIDPKYLVFGICAVCHTFAPCHFSANMTQINEDISDEIYGLPWVSRGNQSVSKMITFMIARTQQPLEMSGMGIALFNMKLFVSILQTSYSFFTLIRQS